jgi:hypothetical protein
MDACARAATGTASSAIRTSKARQSKRIKGSLHRGTCCESGAKEYSGLGRKDQPESEQSGSRKSLEGRKGRDFGSGRGEIGKK